MENIILIGYMGSGKTTVGQNLARLLEYVFVDTDELIVEQQHRSINEIFAAEGEQVFRGMETALLKQLIANKREHLIISTGGGMPVKEENRPLLSALGTVVYLKAAPQTIYDRIKGDTTRPLLQCENPMERIRAMLDEREPAYESTAAVVVEVDGMNQSEAAKKIAVLANQNNRKDNTKI